jgi:CHAT domain-containing protein/Tfp pilus assembly protein PilF
MLTVPVLLLALLAAPSDEFNAAFAARDVGRVMRLWDETSPTLIADRKRLTVLAYDDVQVVADGSRVAVRDAAGTLLEQYELVMQNDRVSSLARLAPATPLANARDQLHRGIELVDAGELDAAQGAFTRAAELADASGHAPTRASARRGLGLVAATRGDIASATKHYESALALSRAGDDRHGEARTLERLAHLDRTRGELARAEARYREALQIFRERGHRLGAAVAVTGIGVVLNSRGQYNDSPPLFREAAQTFEELGELDGLASALNALGVTVRARGDYAESMALLRRALEVYRSIGSPAGMANVQGNLAVTLAMQGQYAEALTSHRESLDLHERLGRTHSIMLALTNTGEMYRFLGDEEQAREHFQRALAMAEKAGYKPGVALALQALAQVHLDEDDPRGATELFEKSLAIDRETRNRGAVGRTLFNLGRVHWTSGDRATARGFFEQSLAIAEELDNPLVRVRALGMLADVTDPPERGLEVARTMMAAAQPTYTRQLIWWAHLVLGRALRRNGQLEEARAELERSVTIVEELRHDLPGEEIDRQQAFANMLFPYLEMVSVLVEQGDAGGALAYAERAKARVLLEVLRNGRPDLASMLTEADRAREATLAAELAEVNRELRGALGRGEVPPELLTRLRRARLDYEAFLDLVFAAHPQLRKERGEVLPARTSDASALLAGGVADAFLEFVVTDERTYLFVLTTGGGLHVHTIPAGQREVKKEVLRYRELLASHDLAYGAAARALYERFVAPAAAQLRGRKTVGIVPDGALWELPFPTLQPSATEFLLDRHALYLAPSLTVLREITREAAPSGSDVRLLAVGNPVVPADPARRVGRVRRDASLAPLPHTETEIRNIAALYGARNSSVHVGGDAREEVVKAEAGRYDVLHFATHGVLDDQNALYSRLVFSPPSSAREDGLLEAREIMRLDLNARLAVLSACETARGRVGAGEGLIGLSWALFVAGVPATVVSQWSVDSSSTAELMVAFHRNLRVSGRSTAEALRLAALATRKKPAYRHPFYWAPFVVVGRPR